ncbi:MAG: transferrin-binding protein-like solute binding protein [Rhodospirillales bacterium]|nr:transferrin-binding protein-like solute binding protein [Rhodospirillales bacterium]
MATSSKRYLTALAACSVLALGLYGCGGGGGDEAAMMPPGDGDGMMPGDGMVTEYGHGLEASPLTSPTASSAADSLENLDQASTAFAPVSAPAKITADDMGQAGVVLLEDDEEAYVESVTHDGAAGYSVVFVVDGQKTQVDFEAADWSWTPGVSDYYQKTVDGTTYGLAHFPLVAGDPVPKTVHRRYFQIFAWETGELRGYAAHGVVTPSQTLVNLGSATYEGHLIAERHNNFTDPNFREVRNWIWSELTLNADFSASTITGSTGIMWLQLLDGTWVQVPDTNSIAISSGKIDENRFHAEWAGQDTDTSSALQDSLRGFEGSMLGEFYGPDGEEVGGVLTGERAATDQVIHGRFGGESQAAAAARMAVQTAAGRDNGISASQDAAVYADSSSDTLASLLPDGNTAFAPLSAAVYRDWDNSEFRVPANGAAFVKSISSDGANGFNVTYVIDGRASTIHFSADTWSDTGGAFNVNRRGDNDLWRFNNYWFWSNSDAFTADPSDRTSGSSRFAYFDINGWVFNRTGDEYQAYSAYGAQTRPENLPAGSASYYGYMNAKIWLGDNSEPYPEDRINLYGTLALNADFDNSEVDGIIDQLALQAGDFSESPQAMGAGNSIGISNGVIADSGFTADWAGVDTDPNTPLDETVRGFAGTMLGQFYGPAAEEVGGVMNGHRGPMGSLPDLYFNGVFGASQPDPNDQQ